MADRPKMHMGWMVFSVVLSLVASVVIPTGCYRRDFTNDPVKWTFVGGDGYWDNRSRKWTVHLRPGETDSATLRLDNTSSQDLWVVIVFAAPDGVITGHLDGPFVPPSGNVLDVPSRKSGEFVVSATANVGIAPQGQHRYVVDLSASNNLSAPAK